jgi:methylmalonyl-CoA mutase
MTDECNEGKEPDETLKKFVEKFSRLEGRQPRVMVCRNRGYEVDSKINEVSVDLAGFGFDVDIGIPFDSFRKLGMNAIENDVDVLVLFGKEDNPGPDFISNLKEFLSQNGYSDVLIVKHSPDFSPLDLRGDLVNWLKQTLR